MVYPEAMDGLQKGTSVEYRSTKSSLRKSFRVCFVLFFFDPVVRRGFAPGRAQPSKMPVALHTLEWCASRRWNKKTEASVGYRSARLPSGGSDRFSCRFRKLPFSFSDPVVRRGLPPGRTQTHLSVALTVLSSSRRCHYFKNDLLGTSYSNGFPLLWSSLCSFLPSTLPLSGRRPSFPSPNRSLCRP